MQNFSRAQKQKGKSIGFVPTMGYLHDGHLSLIRKCRKENDICVLSIFVNPTQFGPNEDFKKYPRDKKRDEMFAKREKIDIIFYPTEKEMYPSGYLTYVTVEQIENLLCGKSRPQHFKGVATIVAKLINCVTPDVMYLGQKDAQQAVVIKKMAKDLNYSTRIKVLPTVREKNGLALSSRNKYLTTDEYQQATSLYRSLKKAQRLVRCGEKKPSKIKKAIRERILKNPAVKIDYIECVNANNLEPIKKLNGKMLIALAVFVGKTRLIDNIVVAV